jgi:hypothetical protein
MKTEVASQNENEGNYLGLHAYWDIVGTEMIKRVCDLSGTDFGYFKLMASHFKPCTPARFEKIEAAAKVLTPNSLPDFETCTRTSVREAALTARKIAKQVITGSAIAAERNEAIKRKTRKTNKNSQQST